MRHKFFAATGLLVLCGFLLSALTGCITSQGPFLGYAGIPIPVLPYWQKGKEDEHWFHERYGRAPILGPLTADTPDIGMDPPSDDDFEPPRHSGGGGSSFEPFAGVTSLQKRVLDYYTENGSGGDGCTTASVAASLGLDLGQVKAAVEFLSSRHDLHSTIDEDHHRSIYLPKKLRRHVDSD